MYNLSLFARVWADVNKFEIIRIQCNTNQPANQPFNSSIYPYAYDAIYAGLNLLRTGWGAAATRRRVYNRMEIKE